MAAVGVALAVLGGVGCSTPSTSQQELAEALQASGLSKPVSECAAKAVIGSLSEDEVADLVERGGGAAPVDDPKREDDSSDKLRAAMDTCRTLQADEVISGEQLPLDETSGTVPAGDASTTTTMPSVPSTSGASLDSTP